MNTLINPLTLPSHPHPYPAYQALREQAALRFDTTANLWIASSAEVIQQIFANENLTVRPRLDKIPANIAGGSAAEVFSDLIRMNEGEKHRTGKAILQTSLRSFRFDQSRTICKALLPTFAKASVLQTGTELNHLLMTLPVSVVARLCGFAEQDLQQLVNWTNDFVGCLSPLSSAQQIQDANLAASNLKNRFVALLRDMDAERDSLLHCLQIEAKQRGWQAGEALLHNLIGLLSQTYEATAGLIGNGIVTLHAMPELVKHLGQHPADMVGFITEVARYDPPIQNTRRFVDQNCQLSNQELKAGDTILLLLAAANRDPQANLDPDTFRLDREVPVNFTFGHARHQCPGQKLAQEIAAQTMAHLLAWGTPSDWSTLRWRYRNSLNGRIPQFTH